MSKLPISLVVLIGISLANGNNISFSMPQCIQCTLSKGLYLEVGNSLIDVINTMTHQRGFTCVNHWDTEVPWLMLSGYDTELSCHSGKSTIFFSNSGETIIQFINQLLSNIRVIIIRYNPFHHLYNINLKSIHILFLIPGDKIIILREVISQLHALAAMVPGCRKGLRPGKAPTAAPLEDKLVEAVTMKNLDAIPSGRKKMQGILDLHNKFVAMMTNGVVAAVTVSSPLLPAAVAMEGELERIVAAAATETPTTTPTIFRMLAPAIRAYNRTQNMNKTGNYILSLISSEEV